MKENLTRRVSDVCSSLDPSVELEVLADDKTIRDHIKDGRNRVLKMQYEYLQGDKGKIRTGVYWTHKACIPSMKCSIKLHEFCCVCQDMHPYGDMYKCSQLHFICWDMLEGFMKSSMDLNSVGKTTDEEGNVYCCEAGCREIITFDRLSGAKAPKNVSDALYELRKFLYSLVIMELDKESGEVQEMLLARLAKVLEINKIKPIDVSELNRSSVDAWRIKPEWTSFGCKIYFIKNLKSSDNCRETNEFNKCAAQFCKLLPGVSLDQVREVQKIEYESTSQIYIRYQQKQTEFVAKGLPTQRYVFHGTGRENNFRAIAETGFVVGGTSAEVPVANGAAHGAGVYTAIGPTTPIGYSRGIAKVMLALGLEGVINERVQGNIDTVKVGNDWLIFRSADQLLPVAIIVFDEHLRV